MRGGANFSSKFTRTRPGRFICLRIAENQTFYPVALSPDKFALRSLSQVSRPSPIPIDQSRTEQTLSRQTLAREFGPKNIHVAHTIIDGLIDTDRVASFAGEAKEADGRISPDEIGKAYVYLHEQARSAWTQELDLR